jgi:hypothetical protein
MDGTAYKDGNYIFPNDDVRVAHKTTENMADRIWIQQEKDRLGKGLNMDEGNC